MDLIFSFAVSIFFMVVAWQIYLRTQDHKVAEVFRPLIIFIVATFHLFLNGWDYKSGVAFYLLAFWAFRRSGFLLVTRNASQETQYRYESLMQLWGIKNKQILYVMQGIYAWVLALPFYFIAQQDSYTMLDMTLFTLVFFAIIGESIAELNLYFYQKAHGKGIYKEGLWAYCRHPNYFFASLVWLGFSCLGVYSVLSLMSLFSALFLFIISRFYFIPITEKYLINLNSTAYKEYQKKVPIFFPYS